VRTVSVSVLELLECCAGVNICMFVCERERERVCVCVHMCEGEIQRQ
jgi:hypothetical protein